MSFFHRAQLDPVYMRIFWIRQQFYANAQVNLKARNAAGAETAVAFNHFWLDESAKENRDAIGYPQ
jgi:hypothetical protein